MDTNDSFQIANDSQLIERNCFNTSIVWKISNLKNRHDSKFSSPAFRCSNLSWKLLLYPRGQCYASNNYLSVPTIFLQLVNNSQSSIFIRYFELIISDDSGWIVFNCVNQNRLYTVQADTGIQIAIDNMGIRSLVNRNPLTISFNFYVEDEFHPEATKVLKENNNKKKGSSDSSTTLPLNKCSSHGCMSMCSDFEELFNNSRLSDVTLKLSDGEFQAHKVVLSARSKVFAAMFEHDTKENRTDNVDIVEMETKTVQDMLRYVYCGKVRELSAEEALNLFVAADRYDLQELKNFCREVVLNGISASNVCDIAAVADLHNDEMLIRKLKSFLSKNGKEVIKTEKWKATSARNPTLGSKMFEWAFSE